MNLLISILFMASIALGGVPKGYRHYKKFPLAEGGKTVELLVDKRLTDSQLNQLGKKLFKEGYRNGLLRLMAGDNEISQLQLKKPIVNLETIPGWPDKNPYFLVTEDWSASFGSYNGPITSLVSINQGQLVEAESKTANENKPTKIELMRSLKTDWKLIKGTTTSFPEILLVTCRPNVDDPDGEFLISYVRFYTDGQRWQEKRRKVQGFWENNGTFPSESLFPK